MKSITLKYGFILFITGLITLIYSKVIFIFVNNIDIGKRFDSPEFYESDLFNFIGLFQIFTGLLYFLIYYKTQFQLVDKATIRNYWFTMPFILIILIIPLLDKYYPTDKFRHSALFNVFGVYMAVSCYLYLAGVYYFVMNFIKSFYAFYVKSKKVRMKK